MKNKSYQDVSDQHQGDVPAAEDMNVYGAIEQADTMKKNGTQPELAQQVLDEASDN